jgi:hypothetical protein
MPDERGESIKQGIGVPPESEIGRKQERLTEKELARTPRDAQPEGGLGGTSDADSPADEAELARLMWESEEKKRLEKPPTPHRE